MKMLLILALTVFSASSFAIKIPVSEKTDSEMNPDGVAHIPSGFTVDSVNAQKITGDVPCPICDASRGVTLNLQGKAVSNIDAIHPAGPPASTGTKPTGGSGNIERPHK